MKLKDIKVGGIYKPTSERCAVFDFFKGVYIKITSIEDHNLLYYDILDKNRKRINSCDYCFTAEDLEPVTSRSSIGKKAYKTFLKNGGKRNSKGQFSRKQPSWEDYAYSSWTAYNSDGDVIATGGSEDPIKLTVGKKIQVDWEKVGFEAFDQSWNGGEGGVSKIFAKVFKDHGLIKEGVEI